MDDMKLALMSFIKQLALDGQDTSSLGQFFRIQGYREDHDITAARYAGCRAINPNFSPTSKQSEEIAPAIDSLSRERSKRSDDADTSPHPIHIRMWVLSYSL